MRPRRALGLAVATVAAAVACTLPLPGVLGPLRALCALLLVLVLPGLAVAAALFPRRTLGPAARVLFTMGLSVCLTALVGYALNWTGPGLQRAWWAGSLGYLTQVAIIVAVFRLRDTERFQARMASLAPPRDPLPPRLAPLAPPRDPLPPRPAPQVPAYRISRRACLLFASAAVIATGAIVLNYVNATLETGPGFTQLWMVPAGTDAVRLGVANHEGAATRYRLVLSLPSGAVALWPNIAVGSGATWTGSVTLPSALPIGVELTATLFRDSGTRATAYRHVTYWTR